MPRDNQFLLGLLNGLYQGGVGNPEVNDEQAKLQMEQDKQMQEQGQIPVHPQTSNIAMHTIKNVLFPTSLSTAYKPDPTKPTYGQSPEGDFTMSQPGQPLPEGYAKVDSSKGMTELGIQSRMKKQKTWTPVAGMISKNGKPILVNADGEMKEGNMEVKPTAGSAYAGVREKQFTLQDLPSNQGPSTAGGAAYQVKVAARQGKALIAKAGSPQRTGLATGDLARSVLRNSPTDEAMRNANFSDNLITRWSQLKQKITADPTSVNNPQIRREIYNLFDEMDKSATPFIKNQLDDMESTGFTIPPNVRKRQLGETLPDIPFEEGPSDNGQVKEFNSVLEATAAKLPKGTRIKVGGRMATVQ